MAGERSEIEMMTLIIVFLILLIIACIPSAEDREWAKTIEDIAKRAKEEK